MKFWLRFLCGIVLWSVQAAATEQVQTRVETTINKSNRQETTSEPVSTASSQLINPTDLKDALDQLAKKVSANSVLAVEAKKIASQQRCDYGYWWCLIKDFQFILLATAAFVFGAALWTSRQNRKGIQEQIEAAETRQWSQEQRRTLERRMRWAGSFIGEVSSFIGLVERRDALGIYEKQLRDVENSLSKNSGEIDFKLLKFHAVENYFNIYQGLCQQLGTFEDEKLPKQITTFYTDAMAFMDFLRAISKGSYDVDDNKNKKIIIKEMIKDIQDLQNKKQPLITALENEISQAKKKLSGLTDADNEIDPSTQANDSQNKVFNSNGIEIAFIDRGKGGPVLLIHGFASNMTDNWVDSSWVERLNKAGFRAIAYDNRGHGMSEKFYDKAFYGTEEMAEDAWQLLNHLQIERADVIGYSMGALIAARLTIRHPDRVRHAIFGGYGINMVNGVTTERLIVEAMEAESINAHSDELARTLHTSADRTQSNRRALAACAHVAVETIPREDLAKINVPVLVAVGTKDSIGGSAEELAKLMTDARALDIQLCNHITAVRDKAFKDGVLEFLRSR